jgi:hypothetical protein
LEVGEDSARLLPYVHAWILSNGETVRLLRSGERVRREIVSVQEDVQSAVLKVPEGCPVDDYIKTISNLHPIVRPESPKKLSFVKHVSQLDDQQEITADNAAITVVNEGLRDNDTCNPKNWYGHASICIEYIRDEQDVYLRHLEDIRKYLPALHDEAHLQRERSMIGKQVMMKGQLTNRGVKLDSKEFRSWPISGRSVTWIKTKSDANKLICYIIDQIESVFDYRNPFYKCKIVFAPCYYALRYWRYCNHIHFTPLAGRGLLLFQRIGASAMPIAMFVQMVIIDKVVNSIVSRRMPFPGPFTKVGAAISTITVILLGKEWIGKYHNCATWVKSLLRVVAIQLPNMSFSKELKSIAFTTMPEDLVKNIA